MRSFKRSKTWSEMEKSAKHVLIVEDSLDLQALLAQLIESEGHSTTLASHGRQALDLLESMPVPPSLILLDLMMPVMDGFEFIKVQLEDPKLSKIPVVVMTADSNPQSNVQNLKVKEVVKKPISADLVLEIVDRFSS